MNNVRRNRPSAVKPKLQHCADGINDKYIVLIGEDPNTGDREEFELRAGEDEGRSRVRLILDFFETGVSIVLIYKT